MIDGLIPGRLRVNCRVGSLEISCLCSREHFLVNCRVGSLESKVRPQPQATLVNCRIGSLEKLHAIVIKVRPS